MSSITLFDGNLLIAIQQALNADWLTPIMKAVSLLGDKGALSISICLMLLCFKKTRRLGILCSMAVVLAFIVCNLGIKPLVDRTRPWITFEAVVRMIPDPGDSSFPSGHANNLMAVAWAFWLGTRGKMPVGWNGIEPSESEMKKIKTCSVALIVIAIIVGISRLYLGVHYPTDVLCGWLCGMLCATISYWIYLGILKKKGVISE